MIYDQILKHHGIKGMRWGVRRNRNRPGGADGKEESTKVKDRRSNLKKKLDSVKRERDWQKVLKNMNELDTRDISAAAKRIQLENSLKTLSKSKVGSKKDREDYLRRQHMSDTELSRKVVRLRAKETLRKAVRESTREQRELGAKIVRIGGSVGVKYAITRRTPTARELFKDVWDASKDPKGKSSEAKKSILDKIDDPLRKDILESVLNKIDKPDKK